MEQYVKNPPPVGATVEDVQNWANAELAKLERTVQSLIAAIEELQNGA